MPRRQQWGSLAPNNKRSSHFRLDNSLKDIARQLTTKEIEAPKK